MVQVKIGTERQKNADTEMRREFRELLDVHPPTTDERTAILSRYTQPPLDVQMLLQRLKLELPAQPPAQNHGSESLRPKRFCREDLNNAPFDLQPFAQFTSSNPPSRVSAH
jgi:hypothetical protein